MWFAPLLLSAALSLICKEGGRGYAFAPSDRTLYSVAHVVGDAKQCTYQIPGEEVGHLANVVWTDKERDLAFLTTDPEETIPPTALSLIRKREAESGEPITFYGLLIGAKRALVHGYVLGVDGEGEMILDAWIYPGASGSPVIDAKGYVIGIIRGGAQWINPDRVGFVRAVGVATPLTTLPSPPKEKKEAARK